jgi:hypothetical protein
MTIYNDVLDEKNVAFEKINKYLKKADIHTNNQKMINSCVFNDSNKKISKATHPIDTKNMSIIMFFGFFAIDMIEPIIRGIAGRIL